MENFRLAENESNIFLERQEERIGASNIILENFHKNISTEIFTIYKDISLLEGAIRKNFSEEIDFEKLILNIKKIVKNPEKMAEIIRTIESIYCSVPNRPTGENIIPPGKYGETYFFTQNDLWCRGFKWLSLATKQLFEELKNFEKESASITEREEKILCKKIISELKMVIVFSIQEFINTGIILTITENSTKAEFIIRKLGQESEKFFQNAIGYGFHLENESVENFLKNEFPVAVELEKMKTSEQITEFSGLQTAMVGDKILILTTSMKHIREIGASLSKYYSHILLQ